MRPSLYLPLTDPEEVHELAKDLPLSIDTQSFCDFVLGFPRKYLVSTPQVEIVKHYLLLQNLGSKVVITLLARHLGGWKLSLMARDRSFLFARIAGTLSCFGMSIVSAEAFTNRNALVLDTFYFQDPAGSFEAEAQRHRFQHQLEDVIEGRLRVSDLLATRWPSDPHLQPDQLALEMTFDNTSHPSATCLTVEATDHFGFLYSVSRCISEQGCSIETAYIETRSGRAWDRFYLTAEGRKLDTTRQRLLERHLETTVPALLRSGPMPESVKESNG